MTLPDMFRHTLHDDEGIRAIVHDKLLDALTPGYPVAFDPDEAELAGAFVEDALSEQDAADSAMDLADALADVRGAVATDDREERP